MQTDIRFDNQVVLVTGAGRGLGRAYALSIAARGGMVVVHDAGVNQDGAGSDRTIADAVVKEIRDSGGHALAMYQNLESGTACESLVNDTIGRLGRVDVVIHNAGIVQFEPLVDISPDSFNRMFSISAGAALWITQRAIQQMEKQGYGRIVYTVSGHGLIPSGMPTDLVSYGMTKGAILGLMNMLAGAHVGQDIRINAISPVAATRVLRREVGEGEFTPEQIAPGVLFLASTECTVTGIVLAAANGRFSIRYSGCSEGVDFGREPVDPEIVRDRWSDILAGVITQG